MKLISVTKSNNKQKKYLATFDLGDNKTKKVHFGQKDSSTYLNHRDDKKRDAYLARHKVNENWSDPLTAGSLSKHLLWGNSTSLEQNIKSFKKRFHL
jgi:hypothetical protein